jgi:hypothetical protein
MLLRQRLVPIEIMLPYVIIFYFYVLESFKWLLAYLAYGIGEREKRGL